MPRFDRLRARFVLRPSSLMLIIRQQRRSRSNSALLLIEAIIHQASARTRQHGCSTFHLPTQTFMFGRFMSANLELPRLFVYGLGVHFFLGFFDPSTLVASVSTSDAESEITMASFCKD